MSAFNWIEIIYNCPSCKSEVAIKCQTYFCSSYDGDDSGRFHARTYLIGEQMDWWPRLDSRFFEWIDGNKVTKNKYDNYNECCYSVCLNCGEKLFVVLTFSDCISTKILDVGLEADWPIEYLK